MIIKNAKIYTMANEVIDKGDILIKSGKIVDVGRNIEVIGEEILDADGLTVIPGIIEPHCHIGGSDYSKNVPDSELNESSRNITPTLEALYSINILSKDFKAAYENGVTTVAVSPGSGNVIGGQVVALKTFGENVFDMIIKNPVAIKAAMGVNPKRQYGSKKQAPMTRMSIANILMDYLYKSKEYYLKKINDGDFDYNVDFEAAIPLFKKEIPLKVHCTQFDIATIIEIGERFDIELTIDHAWGSEKYVKEIKNSGCDVIFGPIGSMRLMGECSDINVEDTIILDKIGVNVSLMTDAPVYSITSLINLAGEVVRKGGDLERTLRMITINSAKALRISDKVGSIEKGKDADIAIFKGTPALNTDAKIMYTIINGKVVYRNSEN